MESRIQSLLDAQWDALESRNRNVRNIRGEIAQALSELAIKLKTQLQDVEATIQSDNNALSLIVKNQNRREELQNSLEMVRQSPLAAKSNELGQKINEIDKKILELQTQRKALNEQLKEVNAIFASRAAKYTDAIEDLDKELRAGSYGPIGDVKKRLTTSLEKQSSCKKELQAAISGRELWKNVCQELESLDSEIKGFKKGQLPLISFALSKTATTIEKYLETASQYGWSALVVAIGHELQILHDTQARVHDAIQKDA